jgi:hypothetical protein
VTVYDLLFIVVFLTGVGTLTVAAALAFHGRHTRALVILRRLALWTAIYVGIVYLATALSKQVVLRLGEPQCFDDWCIAVDGLQRTPMNATLQYDITLRIFSRARRVAQRENGAKNVYLVDARWKRYNPVPAGREVPLNILLQPGESVTAARRFELPADDRNVGLMLDHSPWPICVVIGECGAFHKGTIVRLD